MVVDTSLIIAAAIFAVITGANDGVDDANTQRPVADLLLPSIADLRVA